MSRETNFLKLPLPWASHTLDQDLPRLQQALRLLDAFAQVCAENDAQEAQSRTEADEALILRLNSQAESVNQQVAACLEIVNQQLAGDAETVQNRLAALSEALTAMTSELAVQLRGEMADLDRLLPLKANLASPTFTGTPTAPTAAAGTKTKQIATTEFVGTALGGMTNQEIITSSRTWTAPKTGVYLVELIGGGGGGGGGTPTAGGRQSGAAGGGAGAFCVLLFLAKGDVATLVVGAAGRGAEAGPYSTNYAYAGQPGGGSKITIGSTTYTAGGGGGGRGGGSGGQTAADGGGDSAVTIAGGLSGPGGGSGGGSTRGSSGGGGGGVSQTGGNGASFLGDYAGGKGGWQVGLTDVAPGAAGLAGSLPTWLPTDHNYGSGGQGGAYGSYTSGSNGRPGAIRISY